MNTATLCTTLLIIGGFLGLLATVKDGFVYATGRKAYRPWLAHNDPLNRRIGLSTALTGVGLFLGLFSVFFLGNWGRPALLLALFFFILAIGSAFVTWQLQRKIEKQKPTQDGEEIDEQSA